MSTKARAAVGAKLQLGDGASVETFTTIVEVTSLKRSGWKIDIPDASNFDSPTDAAGNINREYITGLVDPGEFQFTANYIPNTAATGQEKFRAAFDGKAHNFKLILPNDPAISSPLTTLGTWAFTGIITSPGDMDFPLDKPMTVSGTIKVTGAPSFTYHS